MLLHNQRGAVISYEFRRKVYTWDAYGACEVPDELLEFLRLEGFPVDTSPVPPREKAERAAALITDDAKTAEIEKLRKDLADAEARFGEAKRSAETAELRATAARTDADDLEDKVRGLEEQVRALKSDASVYEKMIADQTAEITNLKNALKIESAKTAPPQPAKAGGGGKT